MVDPNPRVAGGGIERLRQAGLTVIEGVEAAAARELNRAFLHRIGTGRPFAILKWAMSLDGRTALPSGASQWISGPAARGWVHRLRAVCDAVIVGGATVRADDPLLTSRGQAAREPLRVVMSRRLDLPEQARLWDGTTAPTLVAHAADAPADRLELLRRRGVERLVLDPCTPSALLQALAARGCNQVLWECGPALAAAALREGCVQEIAAVIAPKLLGGLPACTPLGELGLRRMDEVAPWRSLGQERIGADLLWRLRAADVDQLPGCGV
jgi:diaminohydroxyphosphoribosylaminopyrimidine deaminase/5-amino-6-(5-phosphoribosylamino)uracil reductase